MSSTDRVTCRRVETIMLLDSPFFVSIMDMTLAISVIVLARSFLDSIISKRLEMMQWRSI